MLIDSKAWCSCKSCGRDRFINKCHTFAKIMLSTAWWEHTFRCVIKCALSNSHEVLLER